MEWTDFLLAGLLAWLASIMFMVSGSYVNESSKVERIVSFVIGWTVLIVFAFVVFRMGKGL